MQILLKPVLESIYSGLLMFAGRAPDGSRKPMCTVNRVSKRHFKKLLAGFSKPDMTENIVSLMSVLLKEPSHS
jgi:hypothetical protein